jgi:hypothetical protein
MSGLNNDSPAYTREFDDVLKAESKYIDGRREDIGLNQDDLEKFGEKIEKLKTSNSENPESENKWKFKGGKIGLAFSGGGIRSATFNLGVLQALARKNILRFCDYLSTASGGGYIGSCFSSLLDNSEASVDKAKFPFRFRRQENHDERQEVKWLRRHGNYLVLNMNLFGLDLWRFIGLYLSGVVLTNITTASLAIFLTYFIYLVVHSVPEHLALANWLLQLSVGVFILMIIARWGAALRNLGYKARLWRGYIQGFLARTAALLAILGGFILLAVYLPDLEQRTTGFVSDLLNGGSAASALGLVTGLLKSQNKFVQKLLKAVFRISWIVLLPVLLAQFVRWMWATDVFLHLTMGIPTAIGLVILLFVISIFTNTNRISMHHFYRDRLSEAYIIKRVKDKDDETIVSNEELKLKDLHAHPNGAPHHLINTTLNVPSSKNRWLRGRGADLFVFSKLYCGAQSTGYGKTDDYDDGQTRLATAMAISGAAASPQMGTSTNSIMTFLMTLLNVRLNRWMPNPNPAREPMIKFWPYCFVKELLGKGEENDRLLNLSDGGHHENLAIYELLRRRCEVIIGSDSAADPKFNFGDLANLIRRARIDLGIEIKIDLDELRQDKDTKNTTKHFAVGTIEYPDGSEGVLIYIKTSVTGDEPEDLLAYRRNNRTFPDETTADQFFDEAQFESYRELGYLTGGEVFS